MSESPQKSDARWVGVALGTAAIALAVYHYWTSFRGSLPFIQHRSVHLGGVYIVLLLSLLQRDGKNDNPSRRVPIVFVLIGFAAAYFAVAFAADIDFVQRKQAAALPLVLWGIGVLLLGLELCRRVLGPILSAIVLGLASIVLLARLDWIPWSTWMASVTPTDLANTALFTTNGIFGGITGVSAGVVASFLVFGGMLGASGGADSLMDFAQLVVGRYRGGPGKISVVTSAFFGTVSGSAVANVVVDGVFNIPLMKRTGFKAEFAAAVEATTSAGGQLVPPVMGAAAFIMAEFTGIPFQTIVLAAITPIVLYYLALFVAIHIQAVRRGLGGIPKEDLPPWSRLWSPMFLGSFVLPMTVLILFMYVFDRSLTFSSWTATTTIIGFTMLRQDKKIRERIRLVGEGFRVAGIEIAKIGAIVIAAQLLVTVLGMSALASRLANFLAGGSVPIGLGLVFLAFVVVILGFGVPTAAAYVIAASISTPIFSSLGIEPLPGHLFILYLTVYANVTPPVMPATYAAAAIANANVIETGLIGMRLLFPALFVPFIFVTHPAILLTHGDPLESAALMVSVAAGVCVIAMGLGRWFGRTLNRREGLGVAVIGILLAWPEPWSTISGWLLLAGTVVYAWKVRQRRDAIETQPTDEKGAVDAHSERP